MELRLTDEQGMLAESIRELLGRRSGESGIVPEEAADPLWQELVDFGVLEIGGPEGALGTVDLALVARALGERLAASPLVDTAALLLGAGSELDGVAVPAAALGLGEPACSFAPSQPATMLEEGRLAGTKSSVVLADAAAVLGVPAGTRDGVVLALVRPDAPGVELEPEPTLDPSLRPATVRLDGAAPEHVLAGPAADALVDRVAASAAVLAAAEAVGAAASVLRLAREYAAERRQFGHPIGSFQAVRHLLADMVVLTESSWSTVLYAAASLDEGEPDSLRTAAIAKAWTSRATLDVAHGALQVFGGIAFTAEHRAHLFLRRIASLGTRYGSAADHERELGRSLAHELEVTT
jgi:alkylation response protein AidB-like acyl-CoA dehydrogenase